MMPRRKPNALRRGRIQAHKPRCACRYCRARRFKATTGGGS